MYNEYVTDKFFVISADMSHLNKVLSKKLSKDFQATFQISNFVNGIAFQPSKPVI